MIYSNKDLIYKGWIFTAIEKLWTFQPTCGMLLCLKGRWAQWPLWKISITAILLRMNMKWSSAASMTLLQSWLFVTSRSCPQRWQNSKTLYSKKSKTITQSWWALANATRFAGAFLWRSDFWQNPWVTKTNARNFALCGANKKLAVVPDQSE